MADGDYCSLYHDLSIVFDVDAASGLAVNTAALQVVDGLRLTSRHQDAGNGGRRTIIE